MEALRPIPASFKGVYTLKFVQTIAHRDVANLLVFIEAQISLGLKD